MKTLNLEEILQKISESYEENLIDKDDLVTIASTCLNLQQEKFDLIKTFGTHYNVDPVSGTYAADVIGNFLKDKDLNPYYSIRNLSAEEIKNGIDRGELNIYFSKVNDKLKLVLNEDPSFKNSEIWKLFNKYGTYGKDENKSCPDYVSIPRPDLEAVKKLMDKNGAVVTIETGRSLNSKIEKEGRITIVMTCYSKGKTDEHYDTFTLRPPY